MFVVIVAIFQ